MLIQKRVEVQVGRPALAVRARGMRSYHLHARERIDRKSESRLEQSRAGIAVQAGIE